MHPYVDILLVLEWLCFIVALFSYRHLKREGLINIIALLLVIVVSETVGGMIMKGKISFISSKTWFNLMMPLQFLFLLLLFLKKTTFGYWKNVILVFIGITITLTAVYLLRYRNDKFVTFNYTIEAAFVAACCLHYLFECMNSQSLMLVYKDTLLYLSLGTLLFYLGTLPLHSMYNYLYKTHRDIFMAYYKLSFILNYMMYLLISFGILWTRKK